MPKEAANVDNTLRLLLVTRNEELERELRGLRFLLWRASPRAKIKLGSVVKLTLPLHHEELMRSPVEEFVAHWQEAVEPHGQETDDRIIEPSGKCVTRSRGASNDVEYLMYFEMSLKLDCAVIQNRITSRAIK